MNSNVDAESFLPLKPAVLAVLYSLTEEDRHGYALLHEVEVRSEGAVRLLPAALYRHLARMLDDGLIEEVVREAGPDEDQRRRVYRISELGRIVLRSETARLERIVAKGKATLRAQDAR